MAVGIDLRAAPAKMSFRQVNPKYTLLRNTAAADRGQEHPRNRTGLRIVTAVWLQVDRSNASGAESPIPGIIDRGGAEARCCPRDGGNGCRSRRQGEPLKELSSPTSGGWLNISSPPAPAKRGDYGVAGALVAGYQCGGVGLIPRVVLIQGANQAPARSVPPPRRRRR